MNKIFNCFLWLTIMIGTSTRVCTQEPVLIHPDDQKRYNITRMRPLSELHKDYPYNLDLQTASEKSVNSEEVFKKNGKPTVLLFWLTTCVPCRYEMAAIAENYEAWTATTDFNFYAISTDFQKNFENFKKRVKESDWPWETYHDTNREFRRIMPGELNGLPQTFVLDADGHIVYHSRRYRHGDEQKLFEAIQAAAK